MRSELPNINRICPQPLFWIIKFLLENFSVSKRGGGEMVNREINLKINKYIRQQDILPSIPKAILLDGMRKKRLIAERKERNPTKGGKKEE
jgi:hypothetical protein